MKKETKKAIIIDDKTKLLKEIVERVFEVNLLNKNRNRAFVDARLVFCYIMKDRGVAFTYLGKLLGKHHATIIHYVRTAEGYFKSDPMLKHKYNQVCDEFYGSETCIENLELSMSKKIISRLKEENEKLNFEKNNLLLKVKSLSTKLYHEDRFSGIYKLIKLRTKPGTEELIEKKINTLFNGVYSEEIITS
jgi:hypothetical protein